MRGPTTYAAHGRTRIALAAATAGVLILQSAAPAAAFPGELDDTFHGDGKRTMDLSAGLDVLAEVAIQPSDQKIVAVGSRDPGDPEWAVIRLNPDGSPDAGFGGGDGIVTVDFSKGVDYANAVALQDDGKIVVVGVTHGGLRFETDRWGIARLAADGTLDSTFSGNGKATLFSSGRDSIATDVAIQEDGKLVVTGSASPSGFGRLFTAARLTTTGDLDTSFSGDGVATTVVGRGTSDAFGVALDSLGRIILCGSAVGSGGQIGLARFRPSGRLDRSFSGNGKLTKNLTSGRDVVFSVAVQPDDRIVVGGIAAGGSNSRMLAMRFNVDGTTDDTFSGNGNVSINVTPFEDDAYSIALQDDGRIVLSGSANYEVYSIVRLDSDGTRDATFGDNGVVLVDVTASYDIAYHAGIQADGRIVAVGTSSGSGGRLSAVRLHGE